MGRSTHTFAVLQVSPEAYREIREALMKYGYDDVIKQSRNGEVIDMNGLALAEKPNGEKAA